MPLLIYIRHFPGMMFCVQGDAIDTAFFKKGPKLFRSQAEDTPFVVRGEDIVGIEFESEEHWRRRILGRPVPTKGGNGDKEPPVLEIPGKRR